MLKKCYVLAERYITGMYYIVTYCDVHDNTHHCDDRCYGSDLPKYNSGVVTITQGHNYGVCIKGDINPEELKKIFLEYNERYMFSKMYVFEGTYDDQEEIFKGNNFFVTRQIKTMWNPQRIDKFTRSLSPDA